MTVYPEWQMRVNEEAGNDDAYRHNEGTKLPLFPETTSLQCDARI